MTIRQLGIVVPCFNEENNLSELISRCSKIASIYSIEFILVDNGSTDQTAKKLAKNLPILGVEWFRIENNIGYGNGIIQGLKKLQNPWIGWIHADLQVEPEVLAHFLDLINHEENLDFLKGQRKGRRISERFFTFAMSVYATIRLRTVINDANGQPTIMSRALYKLWVKIPSDFSIDLSALYLAKHHNAKIARLPIKFNQRNAGQSSWNTGLISRIKLSKRTYMYINELARSI